MPKPRLRVLGGFELRGCHGQRVGLTSRKAAALLAYLALNGDRGHSREHLAALFWEDADPGRARGSLRQCLMALRRSLRCGGPSALDCRGDGVSLLTDRIVVDAVDFGALLHRGTPDALAAAVALYQGDLLQGLAPAGYAFEEWLIVERERLRTMVLLAIKRLIETTVEAAMPDAARMLCLRALAIDPLDEGLHRHLMAIYAESGNRTLALKQFARCQAVLARELGVEPEIETRDLVKRITRERSDPRETGGRPARRSSPGQRLGPDCGGGPAT